MGEGNGWKYSRGNREYYINARNVNVCAHSFNQERHKAYRITDCSSLDAHY